jgi:hypothetical protein
LQPFRLISRKPMAGVPKVRYIRAWTGSRNGAGYLPGERREIEFFSDHAPEVEIFRSDGSLGGVDQVARLFAEYGDSFESQRIWIPAFAGMTN